LLYKLCFISLLSSCKLWQMCTSAKHFWMEIFVDVFFLFIFPADTGEYLGDYQPDWGSMNFLINFLRPTPAEGASWYSLLKKAGGGCNDLLYSGHMLVAVLTAMAWTVILYYKLWNCFIPSSNGNCSEVWTQFFWHMIVGSLWRL